MLNFSQRQGFQIAKKTLQIESMDKELRTDLWNLLNRVFWDRVGNGLPKWGHVPYVAKDNSYSSFITELWMNFFHRTLDTLPTRRVDMFHLLNTWSSVYEGLQEDFFGLEWNKVYDFLEYVVQYFPNKHVAVDFRKKCNDLLERHAAGYKFVNFIITPTVAKTDIAAIEAALDTSLKRVQEHLRTALKLLADRNHPDYRNSIKESISAVEALCRAISGKTKATLGDALGEIERKKLVKLHPALKTAFEKIYGYASDESGIRHALSQDPSVEQEDAVFMLVACSAFHNYLMEKARKAGITLQ